LWKTSDADFYVKSGFKALKRLKNLKNFSAKGGYNVIGLRAEKGVIHIVVKNYDVAVGNKKNLLRYICCPFLKVMK
jgi:hypothetical protein